MSTQCETHKGKNELWYSLLNCSHMHNENTKEGCGCLNKNAPKVYIFECFPESGTTSEGLGGAPLLGEVNHWGRV